MQALDIQLIGNELAIKWDDGGESFVSFERLRRLCPCAGCKGERDVMGQLHKGPENLLTSASFKMIRLDRVGGYAIRPLWADGHSTGVYSFEYLRKAAVFVEQTGEDRPSE